MQHAGRNTIRELPFVLQGVISYLFVFFFNVYWHPTLFPYQMINTKGATNGAGTTFPSGAPLIYGFWLPFWDLQTFLDSWSDQK
jgi:hypothetical protein